MHKRIYLPDIVFLMIPLILSACSASNETLLYRQAENISRMQIGNYHSTQTEEFRTTLTPQPTSKITGFSEPDSIFTNTADGQTITISGYSFFDLDPAFSYGTDLMITYPAFVGLTRIDIESNQVGTGMATSWNVVNDGLTWTFTLREEVPWVRYDPETGKVERVTDAQGNVRYVIADDFVYGINRVLDANLDSSNAFILEMIAESPDGSGYQITAKGDHTLEIKLNKQTSYFDAIGELPIMGAQPRWLIESMGSAWIETGNYQAYGPYILKSWEAEQQLTLIKNPYWKGTESIPEPSIAEISFLLTPMSNALSQFSINKTDIVLVNNELETIQESPTNSKYLNEQATECSFYIGFNSNASPVNDPKVRRALSLSLDKQVIVESVFSGLNKPADRLAMPEIRGAPIFSKQTDEQYQFDLAKALDLLLDVYPDPSAMPELVYTTYGSTSGTIERIAELITKMWQDNLGVPANVNVLMREDYFSQMNSDNPPAIFFRGYCLDYNDAANIYRYVFEDNSPFGWDNMVLSSLQTEIDNEEDITKREILYMETEQNILLDNAYIIPIYWHSSYLLVNPKLHRTFPLISGLEQFEKWWVEAKK